MLFTDGTVSTIQDLMGYESGVLDVARTEGIDLGVKLELAHQEVAIELEAYLGSRAGHAELGNLAVTEALHKWHTFRSLALVYRDAYNQQLNDRYAGKWKEYDRMGERASALYFETGPGIVGDPIPQADKPVISLIEGGALPAATYFIEAAWVNAAREEGTPSAMATATAGAGQTLLVTAVNAPANAVGWNVYVGLSGTDLQRQNVAPLGAAEPWTLTTNGLQQGVGPGSGQVATYYLSSCRLLRRG
jgi:hypothetical protein